MTTTAAADQQSSGTPRPAGQEVTRRRCRTGAALALVGVALLVAGTWLHPSDADPADAPAAFAEYAAMSRAAWVGSHLVQLGGLAAMILAMVLVARQLSGPAGTTWGRVTTVFGTAGLALAATLQAVDGVALKALVDLWSAADPESRPPLLAAALAVRQVEVGLAALFALVLGAATLALGGTMLSVPGGSTSLGVLSIVAAGTAAAGGLLMSLDGFSSGAMLVSTAGGVLGLLLMVAVAVWTWVPERGSPAVP